MAAPPVLTKGKLSPIKVVMEIDLGTRAVHRILRGASKESNYTQKDLKEMVDDIREQQGSTLNRPVEMNKGDRRKQAIYQNFNWTQKERLSQINPIRLCTLRKSITNFVDQRSIIQF